MRTIRAFALGLTCVALLPAVGLAQNGRQFNDSWFWGAKGGVAMFKSAVENVTAPTAGVEWLITRSQVALNLSVEQAFFDTQAGVFDPSSPGSFRPVDVSDFRRYQIGLLAFPKAYGSWRPYAGLGLGVVVIRDANPEGTYTSTANQDSVLTSVNDQSSRVSLAMTAGLQAQFSAFSLFGQVTAMPTRARFLINGSQYTNMFEIGIRYNLVGAIDNSK